MVVNYCCPMCETELANTDDYRTHVHGYTSHGQYHTPTCKIGKEKFWGAKKEAAELTDAVAHPREQDDLDKAINDIRRSKLPLGDHLTFYCAVTRRCGRSGASSSTSSANWDCWKAREMA